MNIFAHDPATSTTTLSQILDVRNAVAADRFFGCYAYATSSGFRTFDLAVGENFWSNTPSRWLFGIDYGRTDPRALGEIYKCASTEIRIYDGQFVVDRPDFIPRRDFHAKVAFVENSTSQVQGVVLGSGNFSQNGLQRSVEAGVAVVARTDAKVRRDIQPVRSIFEALWNEACPYEKIAETYALRWNALALSRDRARGPKGTGATTGFWIEAGHVTKNRGEDKPGNQIFAPAGFRRFFGLKGAKPGSTLIGQIVFETEIGPQVTKNYRENDNQMEKLTLPMPEQHGFGVYDGKVLVFEKKNQGFFLSAVELADFELAYGHRVTKVEVMTRGRRFGEFV